MGDTLGKKAERKIKEWLDRPEDGYSFDRIPDQMTGMYGSQNICDFTCFRSPYMWYIESKATERDRFDFAMITDYQYEQLLIKSTIPNVFACIIVLFATYKKAFIIDIREIQRLKEIEGKKSLNIKKIDKWNCSYHEIETIPNNRKSLLDYTGELPTLEVK